MDTRVPASSRTPSAVRSFCPSWRPHLRVEQQDGAPRGQQERGLALLSQLPRPPPTGNAPRNNGTAGSLAFLAHRGARDNRGGPRPPAQGSPQHPRPLIASCSGQPGTVAFSLGRPAQPHRGPQVWRRSAPSLPIRGTDSKVRRAGPTMQKWAALGLSTESPK